MTNEYKIYHTDTDGKVSFYCSNCDIIGFEEYCKFCDTRIFDINDKKYNHISQCFECLDYIRTDINKETIKGKSICYECFHHTHDEED